MIFIIGDWYENRRGKYQVLAIKNNQIQVKYVDGEVIWLSVDTQERIYQNIQNERTIITKRKPSSSINKTNGFYSLLGFLCKKDARLLSFIPDKALSTFKDNWYNTTQSELLDEQKGITIHPPETDKRWYECRITFTATPQEIKTLEIQSPQFTIVKANDTDGWNINNNKLWFALLEYGFVVGQQQNQDKIRAMIPNAYLDIFDKG